MEISSTRVNPATLSRAQLRQSSGPEDKANGVLDRYAGDDAQAIFDDLLSQKAQAEKAASQSQLTQLGLFGMATSGLIAGACGLAAGSLLGPIGVAGALVFGALHVLNISQDRTHEKLEQVSEDHLSLYNTSQRALGLPELSRPESSGPSALLGGDDLLAANFGLQGFNLGI